MRSLLACAFAASVLLASSFAFAEGAAPPESPKPAPAATHWYGYQTLAVDGAALAVLMPSFAVTDTTAKIAFIAGSATTFALGGTIVHWAHHADVKGFADLGIRVGLPLALGALGGFVGSATWHPKACTTVTTEGECGGLSQYDASFEGAAIGGLIGVVGAIAIDAAVLAREPLPKPGENDEHMMDPLASRAAPSTAHVEPTLHVAPERTGGAQATIGVIGVF